MGGSSLDRNSTQRTEIAHVLGGTRITHPCQSDPRRIEPWLELRVKREGLQSPCPWGRPLCRPQPWASASPQSCFFSLQGWLGLAHGQANALPRSHPLPALGSLCRTERLAKPALKAVAPENPPPNFSLRPSGNFHSRPMASIKIFSPSLLSI